MLLLTNTLFKTSSLTFESIIDSPQIQETDCCICAIDFVKFATATKPLADQASWIPYGPVRASSIPLIGTFHSDASLQMIDHM